MGDLSVSLNWTTKTNYWRLEINSSRFSPTKDQNNIKGQANWLRYLSYTNRECTGPLSAIRGRDIDWARDHIVSWASADGWGCRERQVEGVHQSICYVQTYTQDIQRDCCPQESLRNASSARGGWLESDRRHAIVTSLSIKPSYYLATTSPFKQPKSHTAPEEDLSPIRSELEHQTPQLQRNLQDSTVL